MSLAQESQLLEQRIAENIKSQQIEFVQWIFERLQINSGCQVLELCCGTGSQTMRLLELVGQSGRVVALDVAKDGLEKLQNMAGEEYDNRLITVEAKMEDFPEALVRSEIEPPAFDIIFCAYGMYYSNNPKDTLQECLRWLRQNGRIAIVGPYRANNRPLFRILMECGVEIPPFVLYTSQDFMENTIIPWAIGNFDNIILHTMVNYVTWNNIESLITYWKNTTFYDDTKLSILENRLNDYFRHNPAFINEKWVMMVEMQHD